MIEAAFARVRRLHAAMPLDVLIAAIRLRAWIDFERAKMRGDKHRQFVLGASA